jgi:sodium-dependent dicarboxylate transporter 2/3/5
MLPVGTPPNALVFSTGRLSIRDMARAGLLANLLAAAVITAAAALAEGRLFVG